MEGWIKIYRDIVGHWIFKDSSYLKAWIIILLTVNHEDKKVLIEKELIECKRGQSLYSLMGWCKLFGRGWTIQKVRTYFELLKNDSMINTEGLRKTTRLTVCNYEIYQNGQQTKNKLITDKEQADNNLITTNKNDNKDKNTNWRLDFDVYLLECKSGYEKYMNDSELLKTQQRLNPGINVKLSIEKGFINFWGTEAGWKFKKSKKSKEINWQSTITNSISMNKVYYTKQELALQ